jgi:Ca-activated chloride channel family protein
MPYGRSPTVRSHRRGGPRRRIALAPWLVIASVVVLLGGGITAGYAYLIKAGCSGQARATVVVTPRIESIMQGLSQEWSATSPGVRGTCASVEIVPKDPAEVSNALAGEWDTKTLGTAPDAWVPDSSAWVRRASVGADAERIMPDLQPSLARTPTVIAMPKDMAEAAGMTGGNLTWQQIVDKLKPTQGWAAYDHTEWGAFKVGLADPQSSTAGLLALMAISDADDSGDVSLAEQQTLLDLKRVIKLQVPSTADIFTGLTQAANQDPDAGMTYVSAFPALEHDVLTYNLSRPKVPLVAVYPTDGSAEADFPYLVLQAEWADTLRQEVATAFMRFIRGDEGRTAFKEAGFRDPNRAPGPDLVPANGVREKITALPRAILLPESVQFAAASWTAVTRPTNVLLVFDTSGSMRGRVQGTSRSRMDLTKAAAVAALDLLGDDAKVGVWAFSTRAQGQDHRELVAIDELGAGQGGGTHRDAVKQEIGGLNPGGNTGLYNTVWAATQKVQAGYVPGAANIVLLLTDGADDNNISDTISLDQLVNNLRGASEDEAKRVQVITVGLGTDSNSNVLRAISTATGSESFSSPNTSDISQVLLTALFSQS